MQYSFSFVDNRAHLEKKLTNLTKMPVRLTLTNNISTYFSCRTQKGILFIRIHNSFAQADEKVIVALARMAKRRDQRASKLVREFFDVVPPLPREAMRKTYRANPYGRHHNLQQIFDRLNANYFENQVEADITWGKSGNKRRKRRQSHIQLGSYNERLKRITIHPNLDRENVPAFFVEAMVFHEMCHQVVGSKKDHNGANRHHTREFRNLENQYPYCLEAKRWQKKNLGHLLKVG